jgi:ATP adenylyltransferase
MPYILSDKKDVGCILCEKPKQKKDKANLILYRGKLGFVIMNLYPYNNGHLMVCPYQHAASLEELDPPALQYLMELLTQSLVVLRKSSKPEGINIGLNVGRAAGAGIDQHLHFHLVPRWGGDTNFMAVTSDTRVVPEGLESTYKRLKPYFK